MKCGFAALPGLGLCALAVAANAQQGGFNPAQLARDASKEPFVGLTNDGTPRRDLYEIKPTGVSTQAVTDAARELIASLNDDQRKKLLFPVDDQEWRNWANIHRFPRQGVSLAEMNSAQREKAYTLLRASLSAKGYNTSRDIMRLNHHLGELVSDFSAYNEHLYWFTVMGEPKTGVPWGWQIDGHHLIINYFVLGDQVVMTPTFMGSEPVTATSGKYRGTSILQLEQDLGFRLMQSLPPDLQKIALIGPKTGRSNSVAEMFKDNVVVPFEGLRADRMSEEHRSTLLDLIGVYAGNMKQGHAQVRLDEVRAHLNETYFAWKGDIAADAVFYYRIHNPVIYIEFDHQGPIALSGSRSVPTRRHIHTVVRTPNGNDYGKDLLRQHYEAHANDPAHGHAR